MGAFANTFFEERVERLFDLAGLVEKIFSSAGWSIALSEAWRPISTSKSVSRTPGV